MRFPFWTPAFAGVTGVFNILLGYGFGQAAGAGVVSDGGSP
jgi:hypothetical protein